MLLHAGMPASDKMNATVLSVYYELSYIKANISAVEE
jgi:hypothetical protein